MISLNSFNINKVSGSKPNKATFEIGPLPKGYGNTVGTFLRRILLSSIPGSAITAVKIDGVQHEYSTLAGLPDDILTILLSLKNVVVVSKSMDPVTVEINVSGKDGDVVEVKASDISTSQDVKVVNGDYVITKLTSKKAKLKAELTIERGVGYELGKEDVRREIGVLPLDANFSPVKLVSYEISSTRVGQETELDQLNLTIETNGAVTAVEALHAACDILNTVTEHLVMLSSGMLNGDEVTVEIKKQEKSKVKEVSQSAEKNPLKVSDLNLSTRLTNALLRSGYDDLYKLEGLTEEELSNIRGMGSKSYTELLDILKKHSIKIV